MGIAFAVMLMLVELGFQHAFLESTLQLIRGFDADIVLISPTKLFFARKDPFPRRYLYEAAAVRGVASAAPVYGEWTISLWKNPQTHKPYPIQVLAFDPDKPGSFCSTGDRGEAGATLGQDAGYGDRRRAGPRSFSECRGKRA